MTWQFTPFLVPLVLTAAVAGGLAGHAWRRRRVPGAVPFAILMVAVSAYALANALELAGTSLTEKLLAANLAYLGLGAIPPAWLVFAVRYTGRQPRSWHRHWGWLAVIPALTVLLVWTNDQHHLMRQAVTLNLSGPFAQLDVVRGPWYWLQAAYAYLLMLAGTGLLLWELRRARPFHRGQTASLLVGILAPLGSNFLYISRLSPPPIDDLTPFALTLTGLIFAWNLFRWRMLDSFLGLVPLAHDTIVTVMPDAVIILDPQGRVIDLNLAARDLIGQPPPRMVGRPVVEALAGWPVLPLEAARTTPVQMEIALQRAGARRDFDLLISPLRQARGDPVGYLVVLREMTERKRSREALLAAHQQVVGILESISDAFCALDATWRVTYVNHQAEALWGRRRADLLGREVWAELPRLVDDDGEAALRAAAAERRAITFETRSPPRDQWLEVSAYPHPPGLALYIRDITARKQAEHEREALLAREREAHAQAAAATRLREEFLAIASHELRNPLTVLRGYVQLLHRQLDCEPPDLPGLAAAAGQVGRQVERFEALVNDLLDLSRLQQGQGIPRRARLDLADLARQGLSQAEHLPEWTPQHQITLDAPEPVLVMMDAARFEQVLTNLLSNAMKYSPRGGRVQVGVRVRGDQAEVTVSDEGIGIPPAEQPALFQPFSRAEGARRVGYGTGLGLYITARIVEQHGGTIGLTSQPGAGTTVTVRLPVASP